MIKRLHLNFYRNDWVSMKKLFGVTVAMVTPMDGQGDVDIKAVRDLTKSLIAKGVNCLYPCGTTGEMNKLSVDERKRIAEAVVNQANDACTVFIHTGAGTEQDTLALARHAVKIGADGVGIVTPWFLKCSDRELIGYYMRIADQLPKDFPIYLYNIPQNASNDISSNIAKEIYDKNKNVVGIKYSYTDFTRTLEYLRIDSGFSVLHGCDKLFNCFLMLGCEGTVSGVAGVFPEPFVQVYQSYLKSDMEAMQSWQKVCIEICDLLKCGENIAYFKAGLEYRGLFKEHMRRPQLELEAAEKKKLFMQLDDYCKKHHMDRNFVF